MGKSREMKKSKQLCNGCRNDFYNYNIADGCWSFSNAKIVKRQRVGTWQPPPYKWNPETCLSCYHAVGYSMLEKNDCRIKI